MTKQCEHCKKEFEAKGVHHRACSRYCSNAMNYLRTVDREAALKKCEWCKEEFEAKTKEVRFCCISCSTHNRCSLDTSVVKSCEWCKEEFKAERKHKKTCSSKCALKMRYSREVSKTTASKNCEWCKKEFKAKMLSIRFCSSRCSGLAQPRDRSIPKTCRACGCGFVAKISSAIFCSKKCEARSRYHANPRANIEKSREWQRRNPEKVRSAELRRRRAPERHSCQRCGSEFLARMYSTRFCSLECQGATWAEQNPEKRKALRDRLYDEKYFLTRAADEADRIKKIRQDPEKWALHLSRVREYRSRARARRKLEAERLAYLSDPINAARIAEANLARMTPEEKEKWHLKREAEQEKADRKERRDALRKELAAVEATKDISKNPTWSDMEWSV